MPLEGTTFFNIDILGGLRCRHQVSEVTVPKLHRKSRKHISYGSTLLRPRDNGDFAICSDRHGSVFDIELSLGRWKSPRSRCKVPDHREWWKEGKVGFQWNNGTVVDYLFDPRESSRTRQGLETSTESCVHCVRAEMVGACNSLESHDRYI